MSENEIIEDKKTGKRFEVMAPGVCKGEYLIRELPPGKCGLQQWVEKEFSYPVHQDSAKCGFYRAIEVLEKEKAKFSACYPPSASEAIAFLKDYAGIEENEKTK